MKKVLFFIGISLIGVLITVAIFLSVGSAAPAPAIAWGANFSSTQAESLGLNWQETYGALLDDLGVRRFRLWLSWDELESEPGIFRFEKLDWQLDELKKRNGVAIIVIGRKLPRWPECRMPPWAEKLTREEQDQAILNMLGAIVEHYRNHPTIWAWQIENEPLLKFGVCPKEDPALLDREISLVRNLDPSRPIVITDTGEFSAWLEAGKRADIIGSTMYRVIHDPTFGYIRYPFPPVMYARKALWIRLWYPDVRVIFTEAQAEPWVTDLPISKHPLDTQYQTVNPEQFRKNIDYVRKTGFDEVYLWGAEWWYWLKIRGYPEIWNEARLIFSRSEKLAPTKNIL